MRKFDPETLYAAHGQYVNAVEVPAGWRVVHSSGMVGATADGAVVEDPQAQIEQAWRNVAAFLDGCGMTPDNLVRLKMHYVDAAHVPLSKAARIADLPTERFIEVLNTAGVDLVDYPPQELETELAHLG